MISGDLQRANERVASLGRRNEQLREEVERVKSGRADAGKTAQLETTIAELEEDKARLADMLKFEQDKTAGEREALQKRISGLEKSVGEKERELKEVRAKLERQADYEEVKRELSIIRVVEFGGELDDDEDDVEGAAATNSNAKPLEALLLEKNKRLQDELTTLRVEHSELTEKSQGSGKELGDLRSEVGRLKRLNERLEEDLLEVGTGGGGGGGRNGMKGSLGMSAEEALDEMGRIEVSARGTYVPDQDCAAHTHCPSRRAGGFSHIVTQARSGRSCRCRK
jgi:homeobox protein cut-like